DAGFAQGASGQSKTFTVQIAAGQPLRVTLAWTDFPSTPAASVNLNNDLDLQVAGPSGTFLGNVFANSQSATGGAADRRNTLEQVAILAPAAGSYTITVTAFNVPSSAQPFALVVSGAVNTGGGGAQTIFSDDFETDKGWTPNPAGTDTAVTGRWERANPETTTSSGTKQLGTTNSGSFDLVTGGAAGASAGAHGIDGGGTPVPSPPLTLPPPPPRAAPSRPAARRPSRSRAPAPPRAPRPPPPSPGSRPPGPRRPPCSTSSAPRPTTPRRGPPGRSTPRRSPARPSAS